VSPKLLKRKNDQNEENDRQSRDCFLHRCFVCTKKALAKSLAIFKLKRFVVLGLDYVQGQRTSPDRCLSPEVPSAVKAAR
jgi:hypothetical protein